MTPRTRRVSIVAGLGVVATVLGIVAFAGGAASGFFSAGADVQSIRSEVATHVVRLNAVEADIKTKAERVDLDAMERRMTEAMKDSTEILRADIREIRTRPR